MRYEKRYYLNREAITYNSAQRILDILWPTSCPDSLLDVGCATGIWLDVGVKKGVRSITGVDGAWVPKESLKLARDDFFECDLSALIPEQVNKHDVALCIEVAEHLPESRGYELIEFLCSRADVVVFSAAVPGQGGTGHINERVQSYWQRLFARNGFSCFDIVRPYIWDDDTVNVIYKQNMLVYMRRDATPREGVFEPMPVNREVMSAYELDRIHPDLLVRRSAVKCIGVGGKLKRLLKRTARRLARSR